MKRFSDRYAIDPKTRHPGGHEYGALYPNELLHPLFAALGISPPNYEKARLKVLGAAFMYENQKQNVLERQSTPAKEHEAHVALAKKAAALAKEYAKLDILAVMRMVATARKQDTSLPATMELADASAIAHLAQIAATAASIENPVGNPPMPHFPPSHAHYVWVMNLADLFQNRALPLSVNTFHIDGNSRALEILHALMQPLDPAVTIDQLAEAVKLHLKKSGTRRLRKKSDKPDQFNP